MANKEINIEEMRKDENPKAFQDAYIFRVNFQQSDRCLEFRRAWKIPESGFKHYKEYEKWHIKLIKGTNAYYKSEKYKDVEKKKEKMRKLNDQNLKLFSLRSTFVIPLLKFSYDIDQITIRSSGKPVYFRDYIEECLLFETPRISFPTRPLPEPKLQWNFEHQFYDLIIQNVFSDTTSKDFDNKKFTQALERLKAKLPGYTEKKTRTKKNFDKGVAVLAIDKQEPHLDDFQKMELVLGEDLALGLLDDEGNKEQKIKNNIKQTRSRTKKLFKK